MGKSVRKGTEATSHPAPSLRPVLVLVLLGVAWSSACGSAANKSDAGVDGAAVITTVDGCSWPAALAQTDSSSGQCRSAARAVLSCTNAAGAAAECVTNDAQCDTSGSNITGPITCQNQCSPSEFGIVCGYVGPGPEVTPPPTCRSVAPTPSGVTFYCCPCGA